MMVVCTDLLYDDWQQALAASDGNRNCFCRCFSGSAVPYLRFHPDEGLTARIVKQGRSPFLVSFHTPGGA